MEALISGTILFFGSIYILTEAVPRLFNPPHPDAQGRMGLAILGVGINGFAAWRLHKGGSVNESVLFWHMLADVLCWLGVLVVSVVLMFKDIHILNPILSTAITSFVLLNITRKLIKTIKIFLDAVPEDDVNVVRHVHIWSIDGTDNAMSVHVFLNKDMSSENAEEVKNEVHSIVSNQNIIHSIIELHPPKK